LRAFRRTRHENTSTKPSLIHWGSPLNLGCIVLSLLILGLDIGIAYSIYRIARIFW